MIHARARDAGKILSNKIGDACIILWAGVAVRSQGIINDFAAAVFGQLKPTITGRKTIEQAIGDLVKESMAIARVIAAEPMQVLALDDQW